MRGRSCLVFLYAPNAFFQYASIGSTFGKKTFKLAATALLEDESCYRKVCVLGGKLQVDNLIRKSAVTTRTETSIHSSFSTVCLTLHSLLPSVSLRLRCLFRSLCNCTMFASVRVMMVLYNSERGVSVRAFVYSKLRSEMLRDCSYKQGGMLLTCRQACNETDV